MSIARYRKFIREAKLLKEKTQKYKEVDSNTKGVMHEILVGHHLLGNHMEHHEGKTGESPRELHDRLKASMHPADYKKINDRAKAAASHLRKHIESMGHTVHDVHWTSKPGDLHKSTGIHASQQQDASDIVIHAKDKSGKTRFHGVSLKVSDATKKHIGAANPGKSAHYGGEHILLNHRKSLNKKYPAFAKAKNAKERKEAFKAMPEATRKKIKESHTEALRQVAAHVHAHLQNAGTAAIADHIRQHVFASHQTPMQQEGHHHWRMTTHGVSASHTNSTGEKYGHHISDPHAHYEKYLKDHKNITVHHEGGTTIVFKYKGKKIASHQVKMNSQSDPHSSIKGSGTPNV